MRRCRVTCWQSLRNETPPRYRHPIDQKTENEHQPTVAPTGVNIAPSAIALAYGQLEHTCIAPPAFAGGLASCAWAAWPLPPAKAISAVSGSPLRIVPLQDSQRYAWPAQK